MVAAHSGALAGEEGAYQALFDAYGVAQVATLDELADTCELLSGRRAHPGGLAAIGDSGGERAHLLDLAEQLRVPFAEISEATRQRLAAVLEPGLPHQPPGRLGHRQRRRRDLRRLHPGPPGGPGHRRPGPQPRPDHRAHPRYELHRPGHHRRRLHRQARGRAGQPRLGRRPGRGRQVAGRGGPGAGGDGHWPVGTAAPARLSGFPRTGGACAGGGCAGGGCGSPCAPVTWVGYAPPPGDPTAAGRGDARAGSGRPAPAAGSEPGSGPEPAWGSVACAAWRGWAAAG